MAERTYDQWIGRDVYGCDDTKVGEIRDIFYDDVTGRPEWLAVKTGLFGNRVNFVPIAGAEIRTDPAHPQDDPNLRVAYTKTTIKDAPNVDDADDHLTPAEERDLYKHYGFAYENPTAEGTYGADYGKLRPDLDYRHARYNRQTNTWDDDETVRLRKYRSTGQAPLP